MSKSRDAIEAQRTALSAANIGSSVQAYDADTAKLDVVQTYTATQTFGTVAVTGNVDGRDVSVDGTKLDGVETNATADQTGAQIKTAYQAETNAFTDAQFTKLAGVATSANNYSHPANHAISVVTGLQTALDAKVDDSQVLTNVPSGALFTDTNTVYTHPANHAISVVTGLQTALDGKVDDSQVLTNVPSGALFTDTVYTHPANHAISVISGLQAALDAKLDDSQVGTTANKLVALDGTAKLPAVDGSQLTGLVGGGPSLGTSSVIRTNAKVIAENITFAGTENGSSVGPITVNSGYTVTVASGSTWVVL